MAVREGWAEALERSFDAGLVRVPPRATRFVAVSELDLEFLAPVYEVAVFDLDTKPSLATIAEEYSGTRDNVNGLPALALNTDAYVVQLGPQTLGVMRPANRQAVARWVGTDRAAARSQVSPYIQQAAGYSDDAGTDIIMAVDLAGAFSSGQVEHYLKSKGSMLADAGARFDDLEQWKCEVGGSEISLAGTLTRDGLRRLASLVDSPAPAHAASENQPEFVSPGDAQAHVASTSLEYFKTITDMFNDLKRDWRELKTLASGAVYFDRYSRRIEQMPTLNVDEDLLDYGQYVAQQLRSAAGAVRTMGIRGGARQAQISGYDVGPTASRSWGGAGYTRWGGYRAGYYQANYYNPMDTVKRVGAERRKIRAQEKATMATNVYSIRDNVLAATDEVRRAMTEKYQVQF